MRGFGGAYAKREKEIYLSLMHLLCDIVGRGDEAIRKELTGGDEKA
jgi:hypothetical protein